MITCPECKTEFEETPPWDNGECPKCGKEYLWDEISWKDAEGNWDDWPVIDWRSWEEL